MCSNLLDNAYQNLGSGVHCSSRSDPSLALSTAICTDAIYVYTYYGTICAHIVRLLTNHT